MTKKLFEFDDEKNENKPIASWLRRKYFFLLRNYKSILWVIFSGILASLMASSIYENVSNRKTKDIVEVKFKVVDFVNKDFDLDSIRITIVGAPNLIPKITNQDGVALFNIDKNEFQNISVKFEDLKGHFVTLEDNFLIREYINIELKQEFESYE